MSKLITVLVYYMIILNLVSISSDLYRWINNKKLKESESSYTSLFTIGFSLFTLFSIYGFRSVGDYDGEYFLVGSMSVFTIIGLAIMTMVTLTNLSTIRKDIKNDNKINRINGERK